MENQLHKQIMNLYFENLNDEIVKNETLESYYRSFSEKDLKEFLKIYLLIRDDVTLLNEIPFYEENCKEEMVSYLLEHYEKIYETLLVTMNDSMIEQWNLLMKQKGDYQVYLKEDSLQYSISFVINLQKFKLGKVHYQKEKEILEILIPKDLLNLVKKILHQQTFSNQRREINQISVYVKEILMAYGVLSLEKLTEIMNQVFLKIKKEKLIHILRKIAIVSSDLHVFEDGETVLIGNVSFEDEEEVYTFYESTKEKNYKIFTKEEYEELFDGVYHQKFQAYEELIFYLYNHLGFDEETVNYFEQWFILDYLNSSQEDEEVANYNLMVNLKKDLKELRIEDKAFIKKKLKTLAALYPSYVLKGYARKEEDIKSSYCLLK